MDFLGPLPSSDYLFVMVDYYSRYKEIKIMRTIDAKNTIGVMKEIFSRLGFPKTITADNGPQFTSNEMKVFCKENGIVLHTTIPHWPQMNGEVERQNMDILKRLKISQIEKKNWKEDLLHFLMMYNGTPHSVTGKTPSELFYGRQFRDKIPSYPDVENHPNDIETRDEDKENKEKGKQYSDRKRRAAENKVADGEKVYVKNLLKENKTTPTFDPTPHTVIKANGKDVLVRNEETGKEYRRNIIHLKKKEGEWTICSNNGKNNTEGLQNNGAEKESEEQD